MSLYCPGEAQGTLPSPAPTLPPPVQRALPELLLQAGGTSLRLTDRWAKKSLGLFLVQQTPQNQKVSDYKPWLFFCSPEWLGAWGASARDIRLPRARATEKRRFPGIVSGPFRSTNNLGEYIFSLSLHCSLGRDQYSFSMRDPCFPFLMWLAGLTQT